MAINVRKEKMQIELTLTAWNECCKCNFKYKPDVITGMYLWIKKFDKINMRK